MAESEGPEFIDLDWPAPRNVRAAVTTRRGGVSIGPFAALNPGIRSGDIPARAWENRRLIRQHLCLPEEPRWLWQIHSTHVTHADEVRRDQARVDAAWSDRVGQVCVVQTADCLPVFFTDDQGERVAVAHAGWRGLLHGILENTVAAMGVQPDRLIAWLGPAIGPESFEVGDEVRDAFVQYDPAARHAFVQAPQRRWLADLYSLARQRLQRAGVDSIHGGGFCTLTDPDRFYSYRRMHRTGRMASLIWRVA